MKRPLPTQTALARSEKLGAASGWNISVASDGEVADADQLDRLFSR